MFNLTWKPEIGLGEILTIIGFGFTLIGLFFAAREFRRNTRVQRAQFLLDVTNRYFEDNAVRKFFYSLDYNDFKFDEKFIGSEEERWMDSLLYTFDLIGRMVKMNTLTIQEVDILAFQASRVMANPEVQKYLHWLDNQYQKYRFANVEWLLEEAKQTEKKTVAHPDARFLVRSLVEQSKK